MQFHECYLLHFEYELCVWGKMCIWFMSKTVCNKTRLSSLFINYLAFGVSFVGLTVAILWKSGRQTQLYYMSCVRHLALVLCIFFWQARSLMRSIEKPSNPFLGLFTICRIDMISNQNSYQNLDITTVSSWVVLQIFLFSLQVVSFSRF